MNIHRKQCVKLFALFALSLIFPVSSFARNMSYTHGNDYEYTINGEAFFPVVWDIRGAWLNYFGYARDYIGYSEEQAVNWADREISGVLTQALNAGVNTALIRGTLSHDAQYPSATPQFPGRANMIRNLGMNVILGGFKDVMDEENQGFNENVREIVQDYVTTPVPSGYAPIVGIHGFDEPDCTFDNLEADPLAQGHLVDSLSKYQTWSNYLRGSTGYPFGCFLAKPAKWVPSLAEPNTGTASNSTIYQICSNLDFPMLDWYPCKTYDDTADVPIPQANIWGATDLVPTPVSSNHYYAYNNRDELWSINHNETSGSTSFIVYEVTDEEEYGDPGFSQVFSSQPSLSWPFKVASSDYRAADVGNRATAEHNLNSAVVMYHTTDQIEQAQVVMHNGSSLTMVNPPDLNETASTILFCVGEDNYRSSNRVSATIPENSGVIGSADLRILWCGDGVSGMQLQKRVWILGKNSAGTGLTNVISSPLILPGNFMPTGAIWGYFWSDTFPYRQSGFILYNNQGNYVVVYTKDDDQWQVSGVFSGLFGGGINPGAVIAYRRTDWPVTSYSTAGDFLCAIVSNPYPFTGMVLHWCTGQASTMQMTENHNQFYIHEATASDYNHLSFRHVWHGGAVQFFFGGDTATSYRTVDFHSFPGGWATQINPALCVLPEWGIVNNPMRVRHTRRAFADALLNNLSDDIVSIKAGEIRQAAGFPDDDSYASTETYFNNMCRRGEDEYGAFDLEFDWGIDHTTEDNCLFANVQAFGKDPFSTAAFCPPHNEIDDSDTLLYMTVAPIVHGARGLSFYALDMALMAGPASSGSVAPMYRASNTFLDWSPSRNCAENADMVSRVHDVVKMLTGKNGGPDFLSALVDHSGYSIISSADNAHYSSNSGWLLCYDDYECLNFIALEEQNTGDILLLVSKDYDDDYAEGIMFLGYQGGEFNPIQCWGGFNPVYANDAPPNCTLPLSHSAISETSVDNPSSRSVLVVYLGGMPAHSVSLLRLPCTRNQNDVIEDETASLITVTRSTDGCVCLRLSESACGNNFEVYNLVGRRVVEINLSGTENGYQDIILDNTDFSAGMYFAVVRSDTDILQTEKITIF